MTHDDPWYEIYQDAAGKWRWRLKASNGEIIADSGQGYASKSNVLRAIDTVAETVGVTDDVRNLQTREGRLDRARERLADLINRGTGEGGESA